MELARWRARCSREGHYLRDVLEAMVFLTLLSGGPHYRKCTASNVNPPLSPKKKSGRGLMYTDRNVTGFFIRDSKVTVDRQLARSQQVSTP